MDETNRSENNRAETKGIEINRDETNMAKTNLVSKDLKRFPGLQVMYQDDHQFQKVSPKPITRNIMKPNQAQIETLYQTAKVATSNIQQDLHYANISQDIEQLCCDTDC